jgi:hypothetical protein
VRCIHQDDARFWKSSLAYFFKVHAIDDAEQAEIIRQLVSTKRYKSKDGLWRLTVVKHDSPPLLVEETAQGLSVASLRRGRALMSAAQPTPRLSAVNVRRKRP